MNFRKRLVAIFMAVVMVFSILPFNALATENTTGGLCEHHPVHTTECGYVEAQEGRPCTHKHTDACYSTVKKCVHEHTQACYVTADYSDTDTPSACKHECTEASGCVTRHLDCKHTHGADCGYCAPVSGHSCTYVCDTCASQNADDIVDWPEAPEWNKDPEQLADGEIFDDIYGKPETPIKPEQLAEMRTMSLKAPVAEDPNLQIPEEEYRKFVTLYVNGEAYTGGDISVLEGDNFSYIVGWNPHIADNIMKWKAGSWFESELFQVPGLNLQNVNKSAMVINGIKVGEFSLNYNRTTGKMTYKVVFSRYIQFFSPDSILVYLQGSGKFSDKNTSGPIVNGDKKGELTIEPRPTVPDVPVIPGGTGWQPSRAPSFSDTIYSFGKGVKWDSSSDIGAIPQIEWRVVFFEQLQKIQQEYMKAKDAGKTYEFPESDGYLIIEDTLDVNQQFYNPASEDYKYGETPFFIELPILVPGTGTLLNGVSNVGDGNYDGPGELAPLFTGKNFKFIDGGNAKTPEEINNVKKQVSDTPISWTVTTDPHTKQQTLMVNAGVMGTDDESKGITWKKANGDAWPEKGLKNKINECDNKIKALESGSDSPIALLDQRKNNLLNTLNNAVNLSNNQNVRDAVDEWNTNYTEWRNNDNVGVLSPLEKDGQLIVALPQATLIEALKDMKVNSNGNTLEKTNQYQDYLKSLNNLKADQQTYLENRTKYGNDWEAAKKRYQQTLDFYEEGRVYGFVLKVRSKSINTSMNSYSNNIKFSVDGKNWSADDQASVRFQQGIIGNYALGDIVVQKADENYATDAEDAKDMQMVEKTNAGLKGAEFKLYCGEGIGTPPSAYDSTSIANFLDKDASVNGDTYRYTHTGNQHTGSIEGEIQTLQVNGDGKLILSGVIPAHSHWLVETKAPDGYYLDSTPVQVDSTTNDVTYKLLPNVSRSVMIHKKDSYSGQPVEGAEFTLYKVSTDQSKTEVTGFSTKDLNGHKTLWYDQKGKVALKTNAEGQLCIHGLEAGDYVLEESNPAPGYLATTSTPTYDFTLEKTLPSPSHNYDAHHHLLLNTEDTALENEPGVASLNVKKQDVGKNPLADAGFALFRFIGSEAEWNKNPDNESKWQPVAFNADGIKYFRTSNTVQDVTLEGEGQWSGNTVQAVFTPQNAGGQIAISDIPVGHYSLAEVKAPDTYQRDNRSFYFTVNGETVGKALQLYLNPQETQSLKENTVTNYRRQAQLALVKYDEAAENPPTVDGQKVEENGGWLYTDKVLTDGSAKGLEGAVYKLFMRRGAGTNPVNPDPDQLKTEEMLPYEAGYDTCLAVGTTDTNGVLKLSDMKGTNNTTPKGLNPNDYYMIEVKAPEGYLLDQTAILFKIDENVYPGDVDDPAGLVMMAANKKTDYGLRLTKVDGVTTAEGQTSLGLEGATFTVKQDEEPLAFTLSDGIYKKVAKDTEGAMTSVTTGVDGTVTIVGLDKDTAYTFTETKAPVGYSDKDAQGQPIAITLTTASSELNGTLENGVLFPKKSAQIENQRLLGKAMITKKSDETADPLADAEFTLYRIETETIPPGDTAYDPNNPDATRTKEVEVARAITNEAGEAVFENLEWASQYFIQETKAPEGYLLDETRYHFGIDQNAFNADGTPIPVVYTIYNAKGVAGEAMLVKVDEADHDIKLSDAHFYLEKNIGTDAKGDDIWVGYGKGMYITDDVGEIHFLLPPGDYRLTEMKAPDGYILEAMKELYFTIEEPVEGVQPEVVVIDEKDDTDGVVTNKKGESGVRIQKTLGDSAIPIAGVTFQIGWEIIDFLSGETHYEPLSFVSQGGNNYLYTADGTVEGAITDLVTDGEGLIYAMLPKNLTYTGNITGLASLCCWETAAPDGLQLNTTPRPFKLIDGIYAEVNVKNTLKPEVEKQLAITIHKADGKSKAGLEGAEFTLYLYNGKGEDSVNSHIEIGKGTTDKDGNLVFNAENVDDLFGLMAGGTYHIVETKAPSGYILDETHHEVILDEKYFDENFHFTGATLELQNYKIQGSVSLKKVDANEPDKGLFGAEFELMHKNPENSKWEHYGLWRYTTDENGELFIDNLPYGSYQLIERAAPLGYLLSNPAPTVTFQIEENGKHLTLDTITNEIDPNPVRDVHVKKVAADNPDTLLSGAQFQLYELAEDGSYRLRQETIYETDDKGSFIIPQLPVGNYALKEIKAPAGYDIPTPDMTYFAVAITDRMVNLQIENAKSTGGGGGTVQTTSVSVEKIWKDEMSAQRPESVTVQLYRNDKAYGKPVVLSKSNAWKHTWKRLSAGFRWTVDEVEVPEGYEKLVTNEGNRWTITNTKASDVPVGPDKPTDPDKPTKPDKPTDPDKPTKPDKPTDPDKPTKPDTPTDPNKPTKPDTPTDPNKPTKPDKPTDPDKPTNPDTPPGSDQASDSNAVPQTGDISHLDMWLILLVTFGGGMFLIMMVYKRSKKKHQ